ncbi:Alpha/Beta hydrolase protein [Aspergillus recurvatus]
MTQIPTTKQPSKLTPVALVVSPIRSLSVTNASGNLAEHTQHFPAEQTSTPQRAIWAIDLNTARSWPIPDTDSARFPQWLGHSDQVIWLEQCGNGHTRYVVGSVAGPVWDLRTTGVVNMGDRGDDREDELGFAVVGEVDEDGGLFDPFRRGRGVGSRDEGQSLEAMVAGSTIHFRQGHNYRHEDGQGRNVVWFGCLVRPTDSPSSRYTIPRVTNLMAYLDLGNVSLQSLPDKNDQEICRDFCISSWVVLFTAKDPELDGATHTACSCYICPMLDWSGLIVPDDYYKALRHRGLGGACSSPAVSRRGSVAFLAQKQDGYAADKNRVIVVTDNQKGSYREIFASADGKGQWDLSPSRVSFAADGTLLLNVEKGGRRALYQLGRADEATPADLKGIQPLHSPSESVVNATSVSEKSSRILVTCESFIRGRQFMLHWPEAYNQIDEIWFRSASDRKIHAWVLKLSSFNPEHKYPLAYFIHDSQHGSWSSSWSASLNLALFAEHGYVVVAPNVTGSIGYGEDFVNATRHSFAGAPYQGLEHGFEYLEKEVPYIDTSRSVALGCGYGGYMINWIHGQDLGRRLCALASYNGLLRIMSYLSTDAQHSIFHELSGPPWVSADEWRRSDPAQYLHNWSTPQLVIHDAADTQYPVSDAVAAVKTLQLRGVECEIVELAADGGDMREPRNLILFYRTVLDWMGRYTRR